MVHAQVGTINNLICFKVTPRARCEAGWTVHLCYTPGSRRLESEGFHFAGGCACDKASVWNAKSRWFDSRLVQNILGMKPGLPTPCKFGCTSLSISCRSKKCLRKGCTGLGNIGQESTGYAYPNISSNHETGWISFVHPCTKHSTEQINQYLRSLSPFWRPSLPDRRTLIWFLSRFIHSRS